MIDAVRRHLRQPQPVRARGDRVGAKSSPLHAGGFSRFTVQLGVLVTAAALLTGCGGKPGEALEAVPTDGASPNNTVRLYRDQFGVPHVFADSNAGVYFGYGYAVATDRLFQMEMLKRTSQGRVAEVLGGDYLELDIKLRTQYNHPIIAKQVEDLPPESLEILAAYAAGMNARIDELAGRDAEALPMPFADFDMEPSRWSAYDVASIFVGSIAHRYADFNSERDNLAFLQAMEARHGKAKAWSMFNGVKWLRDSDSPTTVPRSQAVASEVLPRPQYLDELQQTPGSARLLLDERGVFAGYTESAAERQLLRQRFATAGFDSHPEFAPASNYWAKSDLADAKGALVNGPQFGFGLPSYVYGVGLHGGDFDVVGSTLLALPNMLFAHNGDLAWGSTAGISDQTDEFMLVLNPDNPEQYRYRDGWRDFDAWEETIAVRGGATKTVRALRSVQGMVQAMDVERGIAWVRARAWEGRAVADLMAWVWLATDRSLAEAESRIAGKSTNINMYTMDKAGRLGYVHSGDYPQRAPGHDPRLPATGDGSQDWLGLRPYGDNPKIANPDQGYIVNWNNRPAADWISSDLWTYTWSRADRAHILIDEVEALAPGRVADLVAINTRSTFEDVNHRYLLPLLGATALDGVYASARELLESWDKAWIADGQGQFGPANTLMEAFVRELHAAVFLDDVGEAEFFRFAATNYPNKPLGPSLGTPVGIRVITKLTDDLAAGRVPPYDFFNGVPPTFVVADSFRAAVDNLVSSQGQDMAAWHLRAEPMRWLPTNFRGVPQASPEAEFVSVSYQNRGTENNVFVADGEGITGRDVNPPGQDGHLRADGSKGPHYDDQFPLYNQFGDKALPFTEEEVRNAAASELILKLPAALMPR